MIVLAHISDLHLDGTERTTSRAVQVMDHLRALPRPVDAVLVTGDIADHGVLAEYEEAARILAAPFPVLTAPGNHDVRAAYRAGLLGEAAGDGPINRRFTINGTPVLMCDSTVPGRDEGAFGDETVDWLRANLDEVGNAPSLIAFHHPPVALHHPLPDSMQLASGPLAAILRDYPAIVAVLTGHAHTAAVSTFAGRPLLVAPAVTWTLQLPWQGDDIPDLTQPPGIAFHVLDDERRLTTHFRVVV